MSDRIVLMRGGRIVQQGGARGPLRPAAEPLRRALLQPSERAGGDGARPAAPSPASATFEADGHARGRRPSWWRSARRACCLAAGRETGERARRAASCRGIFSARSSFSTWRWRARRPISWPRRAPATGSCPGAEVRGQLRSARRARLPGGRLSARLMAFGAICDSPRRRAGK